ncbi:MAG: hypothetical protein ACJA09_001928 [Alcanivorax sp.]|jgi:hypothetical protein
MVAPRPANNWNVVLETLNLKGTVKMCEKLIASGGVTSKTER